MEPASSAQHPDEGACVEDNLLTCHLILCPTPESAEITPLLTTPAQATQLSVTGVRLATMRPGEREEILITSNPASPVFRL